MKEEYLTAFKTPNKYISEKIPHLNISVNSPDFVGRLLDLSYTKIINHPDLGKFSSVKNMWFWLKSTDKDDGIRKLVGRKLTLFMRDRDYSKDNVPNFRKFIGEAVWLKIKDYPDILTQLVEKVENEPVLSYYTPKGSDVAVSTYYSSVIVPIVYSIVDDLKQNKTPMF